MSDYTFSTLAPNEFEDLSKDLLERYLGINLQAFTTGRDEGIDLRHAPATGHDLIVQCKHYAGSRFAQLKRSMSKEVEKLHRLKPERYVLATSCGLTPKNVDDLFELLSPYCKSKHDILGKTDLNGILRANSEIERRHSKLWITSEAVLSRVLQNDVFVQSDLSRDSILRRLSLYVHTTRFDDARRKLNADRVCIISGVPGVGKTTLAEMLLVEHLMDGWELVTIHQNVSEGLRALQSNPATKQIFYYDDFLGQVSSGEKLAKNEDSALMQLLYAVQHSSSKRFILTTREYILAQAKREHEKLARASLDLYKFVVECHDYDNEAKARILANHLYFDDVPSKHLSTIIQNQGYLRIIGHPNYNPRLIESMTNRLEYESLQSENYLQAFLSRLDDPSQLWEHIYEEQLSEASRHLLLALAVSGKNALKSTLEQDFSILFGNRAVEFGWPRRTNDFSRSLNELEGNFIRIRAKDGKQFVEWHNPSVLDFLGSWLRRHSQDTEALLKSATRFEQIGELVNTVPVLLVDSGEYAALLSLEQVLVEAIQRIHSETPPKWWNVNTLLKLSCIFTGGPVRDVTMHTTDAFFDCLEKGVLNEQGAVLVMDRVDLCPWIDSVAISRWRARLKHFCLELKQDSFDDIDEFMPVAKWVATNRPQFSEDELRAFRTLSVEVIENESKADISPDTESFWFSVKENVEILQRLLSFNFNDQMDQIERRIENADPPESDEINVESHFVRTQESSIQSIFDALQQ